ncbi:cytochrome bd oxidase small subunit CydS [Cytobacillus sp. IB215316]
MNSFIIFYAPILIVITSLIFAFWVAPKDDLIKK